MNYALSLENYQGPLETLLSLIEQKKLEITGVNLAQVTGDFLAHIETLKREEEKNSGFLSLLIADFLVIASRLILIKSKTLLPQLELTEEEQEDVRDLEARVRLYQTLKNTHTLFKNQWNITPQLYAREFMMNTEPFFYPPKTLKSEHLCNALSKLIGELEKILKPVSLVKREIITLKERIEHLIARLTTTPISFKQLSNKEEKGEVVLLFLAVLHLIKLEIVEVSQDSHFGEMTLIKQAK